MKKFSGFPKNCPPVKGHKVTCHEFYTGEQKYSGPESIALKDIVKMNPAINNHPEIQCIQKECCPDF